MSASEDIVIDGRTPIGSVLPGGIPLVWERVEPMLERAVRRQTGHTMSSLYADLCSAHALLWVIGDFEAVVVTSIQQRPAERVLWVHFNADSNMDVWLDDWVEIQEAYAREQGCAAIEFAGRRGWSRIKPEKGYREVSTTYRRAL